MKKNFVQVQDINITCAVIAKKFYNSPDEQLNIVAITGTNGKTTTSFILRHILHPEQKTGIIGTIEYDLGENNIILLSI